jgi:dethiobiotin synthetase
MNVFITGTDTNVGKTVITAGIAAVMQSLGYETGVYKPIQSGCINRNGFYISPDLQFVKTVDSNIKIKSTYNFINPVAPALAAKIENVEIIPQEILSDYNFMKKFNDFVVVEGAGGLLCPVYDDLFISDIVKLLNIPLIIVTKADLGTINHTLLTIKTAQGMGIKVKGVIINKFLENTIDMAEKTAPEYISKLSGVEVLGILPEIQSKNAELNPEILVSEVVKNINIEKIFDIKIPKLSGETFN